MHHFIIIYQFILFFPKPSIPPIHPDGPWLDVSVARQRQHLDLHYC